jgi:hypothetical protein
MADTSLGRAQVEIRATLDKLDGDLNKARGTVDGAVKRIASNAVRNLQTIGTGAIAGIGAATAAVAGLGAALAKITIDAAPVQGISAAFDGLAQSAGIGGEAMLEALQRGSAGMVSQRDLMLSFNKAASLVSTDFAVQLPDAMQYLSKVSASTGQDMGYLLDSLVTGVGRLSPMILDNLAIQVSQAEATERAAQMFGVEASALDKTQQQAGMMNVVLEKLAANTASMPDVTESATAKLARLQAGFQDTKDQIGTAFMPALTTVLEVLANLADKVVPPLVEILEGTLAPAVERVAQVVSDFIWMVDVGVEPIDALKIALSMLFGDDFADTVTGIVETVGEFIEKAKEVLGPVVEWISQNVELEDVLAALGVTIATVILPIIFGLITAAAPVIATFLVLVALVALIRTAWENDFMGIRTIVENALSTIKQWWAEHGEEVKAKALEIWEKVKTTVSDAFERIKETISTALENIKRWWAEHGDEIMAKAKEIWEKVVEHFTWFKDQVTRIFETFRLAFEGDWRAFGEKLREVWDEAWQKVKEIGENVWDAIRDFFANTDWGSIGTSILEGIAKGITGGLEVIKNAARDAANAALEAARGFLHSKSPSQKAADLVGAPWSEGVAKGVLDATPAIVRAAREASMLLMQSAERSLMTPQAVIPRPAEERSGLGQIIIYGLTLEGVQDRRGLLAELQGLT